MSDDKKKKKKKYKSKNPHPNSAVVEVQRALESSTRYNKSDGTLTHRVTGTWITKRI